MRPNPSFAHIMVAHKLAVICLHQQYNLSIHLLLHWHAADSRVEEDKL